VGQDNFVFVGSKPVMTYVLSVVTQFRSGQPEVVLRARGKAISRAVDAAEIVRHKFHHAAMVKDIRIGTERLTSEDGAPTNVSSIEIRLGQEATAGDSPQPAP
jgi:archaea-specific DNA-binding protein